MFQFKGVRILALLGMIFSLTVGASPLRGARHLSTNASNCIGDSLQENQSLLPGQSICTQVNGEDVFFGINTYPMEEPGYALYQVELRSTLNTYNRDFSGIGTQGAPPMLKLQSDGHLVFDGQGFSQCIARPGTSLGELTISAVNDGLQIQITDNNSGVIWRLDEGCFPATPDTCISALYRNQRMGWKTYLCSFDEDGRTAYKFGLNEAAGLLGLWKGSQLIWRPTGGNLKGDYLHFQDDGHLTLYRDTNPKRIIWKSDDCIDYTASKLVLTSDGDVQELNHNGAIVWTLMGSKASPDAANDPRDSVPEACMPRTTCVVPPNTPLFELDDNVHIGETLFIPGSGTATKCGPRCYDVTDSGDYPPYDPELGDTLRFAYRKVQSPAFSFRAKVCGTKCKGTSGDGGHFLGDVGLTVRESLDPMSKSIFVAHQPNTQATWYYRTKTGDVASSGYDGSPDVECLWITLERLSLEDFVFSYSYPGYTEP